MSETILVTGAAGFIGSRLSKALLQRGDRVVGLDNLNDYYPLVHKQRHLKDLLPEGNFQFIEADLRDAEVLRKLVAEHRPGGIVHLAAMAAVRYSVEHPLVYGTINVQGSMNLLDAARHIGAPRMVMASTGSLYGSDTPVPFKESAAADRPLAPYPASKRAMELMAHSFHHLWKLPITVVRFFNVYGPHGRPDMMPWQWSRMILAGEPLKLYNGGRLKRDWTYIDDIVAGLILALEKGLSWEILNLGCSNPVENLDFVKTLENLLGKKAEMVDAPTPPSEPLITYADITKARTLLGYNPKFDVEEGLRRFIEWALAEKVFEQLATIAPVEFGADVAQIHAMLQRWLPNSTRALTSGMIFLLSLPAIAAAPDDVGDVLRDLNHTIEWYHRVAAVEPATANSQEILLRDNIRQNAGQVLRLAFSGARGQAAWLATQKAATPGSGNTSSKNLAQAAVRANQRVTQAQTQLDQVNEQIKDATQPAPQSLAARRDMLVSELNLARIRQGVIADVVGFNATNGSANDLSQRIDDLERSVPEAQANAQTTAPAKADTSGSPPEPFRPESAGIINLVTEMFTLTGRMKEISGLSDQTANLHKQVEALRDPLRKDLLDAIHRADAMSQSATSDDPAALAAEGKEFDALSARFKLLTAAEVPLGKEIVLLDSVQSNLGEWRSVVGRTYARVIRALLIRMGGILLSIFIVLGISAIWKRATFRYVNDARRRRQFLTIRRLLVGAIIVVIVIGGVVTEFSTLMTFAGLITAGVAVALQTVILSGVAHFFFMGRYGVRVGDRVTISGITGDVIDIGIFRLYLMELGGDGKDLEPTGRIVVFSNSVLFQPSAFFKQLPGADYAWHEVALTLAPDTNHEIAEKKLLGAIQNVFGEYRATVEQQYKTLKSTAHFNIPPPEPNGRFRFVDQGLEFVIRYPVEIRRGAEIDDRVTRELLHTINKEPSLKLVASGTPKIQPAEVK